MFWINKKVSVGSGMMSFYLIKILCPKVQQHTVQSCNDMPLTNTTILYFDHNGNYHNYTVRTEERRCLIRFLIVIINIIIANYISITSLFQLILWLCVKNRSGSIQVVLVKLTRNQVYRKMEIIVPP